MKVEKVTRKTMREVFSLFWSFSFHSALYGQYPLGQALVICYVNRGFKAVLIKIETTEMAEDQAGKQQRKCSASDRVGNEPHVQVTVGINI